MGTMPFLIQRQQIGLKLEVTEGTEVSIVDADVIAPAYDIEYSPQFKISERNVLQSSFSRIQSVAGERSAKISFSVEVKGSGSVGTAPYFGDALQACGFSEGVSGAAVSYVPASQSIASACVEVREGSQNGTFKSKKIIGARGNVSMECVKGDIVRLKFEFTGKYKEPSDTTAWTTPAVGVLPVAFLGVSLSFQSVGTLKCQKLSLDMGNSVSLRNDANEATGNRSAVIVARSPKGSIDPEQEETATINFFNKLTTNAEGITSFNLTGAAGNITSFSAPKTQIMNLAEADRDGIRIENVDLSFNESAAAGNDEVKFIFT